MNVKDYPFHPVEKIAFAEHIFNMFPEMIHPDMTILDTYSGGEKAQDGNMSRYFRTKGKVTALRRKLEGDTPTYIHMLLGRPAPASGSIDPVPKFDVIDIDGFTPQDVMPMSSDLMKNPCLLFISVTKTCHLRADPLKVDGIIRTWGNRTFTPADVMGTIIGWGHSRKYNFVPVGFMDIGGPFGILKFAFYCTAMDIGFVFNHSGRRIESPHYRIAYDMVRGWAKEDSTSRKKKEIFDLSEKGNTNE